MPPDQACALCMLSSRAAFDSYNPLVPTLLGNCFSNFCAVFPLSTYNILNRNTVFFIERHVYKYGGDVKICHFRYPAILQSNVK